MSPRKYICVFLAAVFLTFSCGCDWQEEGNENTPVESFVYEKSDDPRLMAASDDVLYTLGSDENLAAVISAYNADGKEIQSATFTDILSYDIKALCADDSGVYAAVSGGKFHLCRFDLSGSFETLAELEDLENIEKIGLCGGKLFWLGKERGEPKNVGPFADNEGVTIYFENTGRKMGFVDLASGKKEFSEIEFPVSFSVSGSTVTVYGFDSDGGYYFADYAKPSEKKYTNKIGLLTNFEFYGDGGEFAFIGANDFQGVLPVSKADSESGVIRAVSGVYPFFASDICASEAGYIWLKTADSAMSSEKKIKRYDLSGITVSGNPIRLISSQYFSELPFSAGSEIQMNQLSGEGFSLKVLSLDKSYDAAIISSEQGVANDIKKKGCFYPLNDVPGVSEYLDKCFPYIKDAVTDKDGNICMLPILAEIPLITYNEKNCAESGVVLSRELEPFIQAVKQTSTVSEYYDCTRYWLVQTQLIGYISEHKSFDTGEFRQLAALLKEQCTEEIFKGNSELYSALMTAQSGMDDRYYTQIYEKTLFTQLLYRFQQVALIHDENLRAAPMPVSGNGKSVAVCTFLCVNPYSDRLSETLGFIENTVTTMSSERNSYMLADPSTYENTAFARDLYSIYENGEVCFQIPSEIYADDFERYCAGDISLDSFIAEADRKLSAYLNE